MCGVFGIFGHDEAAKLVYLGLHALQHRGQESTGIVTSDGRQLFAHRGMGHVIDVYSEKQLSQLRGMHGIGHVRYSTSGASALRNAQPIAINYSSGSLALAHNGNLTNTDKLRQDLFKEDLRHLNTDSDSEVLLNVFAHELQLQGKLKPNAEDIFNAVRRVHKRAKGGYAAIAMIANYGIVAFRDPNGIRPLVFGSRETDRGTEYMIASESVALDTLGYKLIRDVAPAEAIFISVDGELHAEVCAKKTRLRPCIFEHVYFARPDSIMDGVSVYRARWRQGEKLADKILAEKVL